MLFWWTIVEPCFCWSIGFVETTELTCLFFFFRLIFVNSCRFRRHIYVLQTYTFHLSRDSHFFFVLFLFFPNCGSIWSHATCHRATAFTLTSGDYHVVGAVRDLEKMKIVAELEGFDMDRFTPMCAEQRRGACSDGRSS